MFSNLKICNLNSARCRECETQSVAETDCRNTKARESTKWREVPYMCPRTCGRRTRANDYDDNCTERNYHAHKEWFEMVGCGRGESSIICRVWNPINTRLRTISHATSCMHLSKIKIEWFRKYISVATSHVTFWKVLESETEAKLYRSYFDPI